MLLGIYGLIFEGYNPGAIVPGVVGAIALLLALFSFQILPVNFAGLALILLGVMLMVSEFLVPSFGALGIGGIAAFVFGSLILIDTDVPGFARPTGLIAAIATLGKRRHARAGLGRVTLAPATRRQRHRGDDSDAGRGARGLRDRGRRLGTRGTLACAQHGGHRSQRPEFDRHQGRRARCCTSNRCSSPKRNRLQRTSQCCSYLPSCS